MLYIAHVIRYSPITDIDVEVVVLDDFSSVDLFVDMTRQKLALEHLDDYIVNVREGASGRILIEFSMNTTVNWPDSGVDAPWVTVQPNSN